MRKTAEDLAVEFGLKFEMESSRDGRWCRFKFQMPDVEAPDFAEVVKKVTAWRTKIEPWLFIGTADTVATQLTLGSRITVAWYNRKNRKAIGAFWSDEAQARRLALSQPTPQQGINVLKGTRLKEKSTKKLLAELERAVAILEDPSTPAAPPAPPPTFPQNLGDQLVGRA